MTNDQQITSRVMIDAEAFCQADPISRPTLDLEGRVRAQLKPAPEDLLENFQAHQQEEQLSITDEHALTAPASAPGFSFEEKLWAKFGVKSLRPITWASEKWDQLRLDENRKKDIWRLVNTQIGARNPETARKKGLGLVFLLYGQTGSGKSFTVGKL
jgi:hypothetical protein